MRDEFVFTFHYVSINTRSDQHRGKCRTDFTFHYVSINTRCSSSRSLCFLSLHSTMFLLIPLSAEWNLEVRYTLHSTMFLLIRKRAH